MRGIFPYIHQKEGWPSFTWKSEELESLLAQVRNIQGKLVGRMEVLDVELRGEADLETLTLDGLKSSEIEGELLDVQQVRSSFAKRLGIHIKNSVYSERDVEGLADMIFDATKNHSVQLTENRLFGWHESLFSRGKSGLIKIKVGTWRTDSTGPMQLVSGALGKEKVHFEAPASNRVAAEMKAFLKWFNAPQCIDPVFKAGLAHLWFVTIHPFEDGNGRITRALTDLLLAKADGLNQRFYSMSAQIRKERKAYYHILEKTQQGSLDVTAWLHWFLNCLQKAIKTSNQTLEGVLFKHRFWNKHSTTILNKRQGRMLAKLLEGFDGKLYSSKWAKMCKCSADTALRDIQDLMKKGILQKEEAGGRSTNYELIKF
ncbi:MAG: Fic family protein [Bacteroidia bacterium]|jgi:Fic family protein